MAAGTRPSVQSAKAANLVLGGSAAISVAALVYVAYHYTWTGERSFASSAGMILYYGVPALSASLSFVALTLPRSHKIKLALLLFCTTVSAYAVEAAMVVWSSLPSVGEERAEAEKVRAIKARDVNFDTRTKLEVVNDLRDKGIDAYPSIAPIDLLEKGAQSRLKSKIAINGAEVLPLGGISRKVSVLCNESGEYIIYNSDEHGFHNPEGIWGTGQVEVVALGDAFAQGFCVPPDKSLVALVRKRYAKTLSLGAAANGPLLMLAGIKEYAGILRPRVVLWFHYEADLGDLQWETNHPLLIRYLNPEFRQGLFNRQAEIDHALASYAASVLRIGQGTQRLREMGVTLAEMSERIGEIVRLGQVRYRLGLAYGATPSDYPPVWDLFRLVLSDAKASVESWGGKLYFVYLPNRFRYAHKDIRDNGARERVLATAGAIRLPVIDIHQVLLKEQEPLALFPFRGAFPHYNVEGHRLVGEEVLRHIAPR